MSQAEAIADVLSGGLTYEVVMAACGGSRYAEYQGDPVGFVTDVLGEKITGDVARLLESVRDHEITIAVSANATGKSHGAARAAIWFYMAHDEAQVYTGAAPPLSNLENILWGEIGNVIEGHPSMFKGQNFKSLHLSRGPLDFLTGVTIPSSGTSKEREAKFSGKHRANLLFILDEGDAIPEEVYRGIESCMSGGRVRLLVMFNPRQKAGAAYRMIREGRANVVYLSAFSHPNVITGEDKIPGAVTREATVRRINEWCRQEAEGEKSDDSFDLPDFLVGATAKNQAGVEYPPLKAGRYVIMDSAFSYMVLGRYPAQAVNQLISEEWMSRARARWDAYVAVHGEKPPQGVRPVASLDVADDGGDLNTLWFRYGGFVARPQKWSGMDLAKTEERAARECKARKTHLVLVDATGVGAGVAPHLRKDHGVNAHKVKSAWSADKPSDHGEFRIYRDQLHWEFREWLRNDPGAMIPPDEMLQEEALVLTYEVKGGKVCVMPKDTVKELLGGRSPDSLDGLVTGFADPRVLVDPLDLEGCAA